MSQKTSYICDGCDKEIDLKPHLSIVLDSHSLSGIAMPPDEKCPAWRVQSIGKRFVHFHSGACAGRYFGAILKRQK